MGKTSIREMAALIKHSDIIISPDSGPAHIGTIMGTPVIGLYAMTNPLRSGPYNSTEWLINKYPEALKIYMDKLPEEVKWGQKIQEPDAMNLITSDDVIKKIKQLIDKK
jgi:heptosyltransferase I